MNGNQMQPVQPVQQSSKLWIWIVVGAVVIALVAGSFFMFGGEKGAGEEEELVKAGIREGIEQITQTTRTTGAKQEFLDLIKKSQNTTFTAEYYMDTGSELVYGVNRDQIGFYKEYFDKGRLRRDEYKERTLEAGETVLDAPSLEPYLYPIFEAREALFYLDDGNFYCREISSEGGPDGTWKNFNCTPINETQYRYSDEFFETSNLILNPAKYEHSSVKITEVGSETVAGQSTRCFEKRIYTGDPTTFCLNKDGIILKIDTTQSITFASDLIVTKFVNTVNADDFELLQGRIQLE